MVPPSPSQSSSSANLLGSVSGPMNGSPVERELDDSLDNVEYVEFQKSLRKSRSDEGTRDLIHCF